MIKTRAGYERIRYELIRDVFDGNVEYGGLEWRFLEDLASAFDSAFNERARKVVICDARFACVGWEKFQRRITFDFRGRP